MVFCLRGGFQDWPDRSVLAGRAGSSLTHVHGTEFKEKEATVQGEWRTCLTNAALTKTENLSHLTNLKLVQKDSREKNFQCSRIPRLYV